MRRAKVVIVGGGPAGLAAALALAERGRARDVVVLEKATYPREKPCAGAVSARGLRVLDALGVGVERLDVARVVVREVRVATRAGEARVRPSAPIGVVVRRAELDHALAREVRRRGVEIVEGANVRDLVQRGERVIVETQRGAFEAELVVGADGVGSVVRRAMGLGRGALRAQVVEVDVEPTRAERDEPDVLAFDLGDRALPGYTWSFPTPLAGGVAACRGVYQLAGFGDARDVGALLDAEIARAGATRVLGKTKRFAERGFDRREPAAKGRLILAGEALGIDAATGEGIAQALAMGAHAGAFAAHVLGGRVAPERWALALQSTWVALDLRLRARAARAVFDPRRRAALEPLLVDADIADVATRLFAGHRQSAGALVRSVRRIAGARARC